VPNAGDSAIALPNCSTVVKPLRLAVDTNLLLDLADEVEDVLDAFSVIQDRLPKADRLVSPSVLDELAYLTDSGQTPQLCQSARRAMQQLRTDHRFYLGIALCGRKSRGIGP
jgi:hypothetical protein